MRFAILIALLVLMPLSAGAQPVPGGAEPVTISILPENPRPYDTIVITPKSNVINLPASTVTISVNGTVLEEGSGGRTAAYTLGGPGTAAVIRVVATFNGDTFEKTLTLNPADVALVIEPTTGSHPFYEGASLVAPEGRVRIIAMADLRSAPGTRIAPANLSYTWKLGNRMLAEQSGIGRSVLTATAAPRYRDAEVSVTVATTDGTVRGAATAVIAATSPELLAYRDDPLLGPDFAHALAGSFAMTGGEETFLAVPYHFGTAPSFAWTLNGSSAGSADRLTVRAEKGQRGTARIGATASDPSGETADTSFTIDFGTDDGGFFGF